VTYHINEIFYTLQGEGAWTGHAAVFCRFSGCNLWSGYEEDRAGAICTFCDTDFVDSTVYELEDLVEHIDDHWPGNDDHKLVVLTGGEPAKQIDFELVRALHLAGFVVHVETNGTLDLPPNLDWVCVSPKTRTLRVRHGSELKLVYPQERITPDLFERLSFGRFSLSPMDGPDLAENTAAAVEYVLAHPQWRLNIQTHKMIGVR
jgi:7-carboxy-7-deazaguanine synthase